MSDDLLMDKYFPAQPAQLLFLNQIQPCPTCGAAPGYCGPQLRMIDADALGRPDLCADRYIVRCAVPLCGQTAEPHINAARAIANWNSLTAWPSKGGRVLL